MTMKIIFIFLSLVLFCYYSCYGQSDDMSKKNLNCLEYWSNVPFSDFCGLTSSDFKFNTISNDICNADQGDSFSYDDLISIQVFNHFSNDLAKEEYEGEDSDAKSLNGYSTIDDLADNAFALLITESSKLDFAIIQVVKDTYTVYLEVNRNTAYGSNNCFDESSVLELARALVKPL